MFVLRISFKFEFRKLVGFGYIEKKCVNKDEIVNDFYQGWWDLGCFDGQCRYLI